jgi:hypothetical protein
MSSPATLGRSILSGQRDANFKDLKDKFRIGKAICKALLEVVIKTTLEIEDKENIIKGMNILAEYFPMTECFAVKIIELTDNDKLDYINKVNLYSFLNNFYKVLSTLENN